MSKELKSYTLNVKLTKEEYRRGKELKTRVKAAGLSVEIVRAEAMIDLYNNPGKYIEKAMARMRRYV